MLALCIGLVLALDLRDGTGRRHHHHHHHHHRHVVPKAALAATAREPVLRLRAPSERNHTKRSHLAVETPDRTAGHAHAKHEPESASAKEPETVDVAKQEPEKAAPATHEPEKAAEHEPEEDAPAKQEPEQPEPTMAKLVSAAPVHHEAKPASPGQGWKPPAVKAVAEQEQAEQHKQADGPKAEHVKAGHAKAEDAKAEDAKAARKKAAVQAAKEAAEHAMAHAKAARAKAPVEAAKAGPAKAPAEHAKAAPAEHAKAAPAKAAPAAHAKAAPAAHAKAAPAAHAKAAPAAHAKAAPAAHAKAAPAKAAIKAAPAQVPRLRASAPAATTPMEPVTPEEVSAHIDHVLDDEDAVETVAPLPSAAPVEKLSAKAQDATLVTGGTAAVQPLDEGLQPLLKLDFDKEDEAYQRVSNVIEQFPRIASQPIWNLVNPSALASHTPPVVDMRMHDLKDLLSPDGRDLAKAFPDLRLRDLPLFEWMPAHVAPKDWANPAEVSMPDYVEFFPELVARGALQDVRLTDLKAVAERKRAIWADTWKAVHSNDTNVDLNSRVKELEYKLHQALQQKQQAVVTLQATEKEHDRLVVEKKSLQKKYEDDQDLIMHQQRMLAEGTKVLGGLELKVTGLEATRREQREQLEALQERQLNFSHQVTSLKQEVYEKTQEIFQLGADKEELLRRIQMLQHRLLQQAQLATQLKAAQREDVALKEQLNATLADEDAQARTNAALTSTNAALTQQVQTLERENHRLASVNLGRTQAWGAKL